MPQLHDYEIELPFLTAAEVSSAVPALVLKDLKNWSDRGLVHFVGVQRNVYQRRVYSLRSIVEAYALHAMQTAGVPLDTHGAKFAAVMVARLREWEERGIEFLTEVDDDDHDVAVYAFGVREGKFGIRYRFAPAGETLGELMRQAPFVDFIWEVRLFPVDYALMRLVESYFELRHHRGKAWEEAVYAGVGFGTSQAEQAGD